MALRRTAISMLVAVLMLVCAFPATAGMVIKYGHVAPPFHGQSMAADHFAKYVFEKTNGAIEVKTFPMGQLGGERSLAEQVQAGTLQLATVSTAVLMNFVPQVAVAELPFVYPDRRTAYAVLDSPMRDRLFSYLPAKGFVGLGWTENEFRDITAKKPIRTPDDLKGVKIRVMESPIYLDTFKQLGASPVGIPFPEIYNALQQGVIDAQENPLFTSILMKFTEVNKYVTLTNHFLTECIVICGVDFWNSLKPEYKKIFMDAAYEAQFVNRGGTMSQMLSLPKLGISVAQYCRQNNIEVIELTPAERKAFKDACKPVWDKYRPIVGPELFDDFVSTVDAMSKR